MERPNHTAQTYWIYATPVQAIIAAHFHYSDTLYVWHTNNDLTY